MKKLVVASLVLAVILTLAPFRVFGDDGKLIAEEANKILQSVNSNIANYDMETHLVTFKDGSKPIYVTPKGENSQNGEVTWEYFIQQKGDLRGWFKLPVEEIVRRKREMIEDFDKKNGIENEIKVTSSGYPDSYYVSCTQFPQQEAPGHRCGSWCGPAATQSVLSGWGITGLNQSDIAYKEDNVACDGANGASEDSIASTLNWYIGENWYGVNSWGLNPTALWLITYVDVGNYRAFVSECDTIFLKNWRDHVSDGSTNNRVHYIAVRGYWTPTDSTPVENDWQRAVIADTDSATSLHPTLSAYASENFYGGITYTSIPSGYTTNPTGITSLYNANLRYPVVG